MIVGNKGVKTEIVRVASWEGYSWLRHGFSTRGGGVSSVYGGNSLNLGWTKEDDQTSVRENRRRFLSECCGSAHDETDFQMVTLKQVHSGLVIPIRQEDGIGQGKFQTTDGKAVLESDGSMTDVPGVMLGIQTADCVPVLVADVEKRVVAAFHAGWRGTVARIAEHGIQQMQQDYGSRPEDLVAAIGPSIGACCYAIGDEVRSGFEAQFRYAEELFRTADQGKMHLDLWKANRRQLLASGIPSERITVVGECTACARNEWGERKYFSHRAEHGFTGRMMSAVGVARSGIK